MCVGLPVQERNEVEHYCQHCAENREGEITADSR
jgi:hypothetical protein